MPNAVADELYWATLAGRIAFLTHDAETRRLNGDHDTGIDPSALALNDRVLSLVAEARADGKKTFLASQAHPELAERILQDTGLFDAAMRTGDELRSHIDAQGYLYLGPQDDGEFWQGAAHIVTVGASSQDRGVAATHPGGATHIGESGSGFKAMLRALRPHQWLKNALIFLPVIAAQLFDIPTLMIAALAFVSFSLVASSVYVLNDLLDLAADRAHPRKRNRPFASGDLQLHHGKWMLSALLGAGVLAGAFVGLGFLGVLAAYYATTLLYSFGVKKRPVIDICVLAGLYTMRILAGGVATGIELSVWLLAFSVFLFLSLAAMKRQAELVDGVSTGRTGADGRGYRVDDLPLVSQMALTAGYVSVLVMALYLSSPEVQEIYSWPGALWGICLVLLYWISRAVFKTHRGQMHDDPIVFALTDNISRLSILLVFIFGLLGSTLSS